MPSCNRRSFTCVIAALAVILFWGDVCHGQLTNSTLVGTVQDASGAPVAGATVSARNTATNESRSDTTNADGMYRIPNLPPAVYELRVGKAGFKNVITSGVTLHVGETSRVDVTLQVGTVAETVEVTGGAILVNTEDAGTTDIVEQKQVEELPLMRRNIYQLPVMEPGTTPTHVQVPTYYSNSSYDMSFVTYGKSIRATNFMLDGAPNNDNGLGGVPAIAPILDAVQEFQVSTNDFAREFGRNFGADINVATKSGTNLIHGSAWEFHRNAALNAKNFFDAENPSALIQNQFGFTLGGPIQKDKTFWFMAYESFREKRGTTRDVQVETPQLRQWVAENAPNSVANYLFTNFPGPSTILPGTGVSLDIQGGGLPDLGTGVGQAVNYTTNDEYIIRVDHNFGIKDKVFVRWADFYPRTSGAGELTTIGGLGRQMRGFRRPADGTVRNLAVGYTHMFGQSMVNDFRFGYLRNQATTSAYPETVPNMVMLDFTLGFGSDFFLPISFRNNEINFKDNLFATRGNHGLKMGVEFNNDRENGTFDAAGRGVFVFLGLPDLVNDSPLAYLVQIDPVAGTSIVNSPNDVRNFRRNDVAWFFQDDWKPMKNLTINAGVRWEYFGVIKETNGKQAGMTLGPGNNIQDQLVGASVGPLSEMYSPNYKNFGPLLGLAWDPTGKGKFSVRAGWAINFDRIHNDLMSEPARFTPPYGAFAVSVADYTDPVTCPMPDYTISNVFQYPPVLPAGFGGGLDANGFLGSCLSGGLMLIDRNLRTPYVEQWNLTLQYGLANDWMLELSYAGNQGHRLAFSNDPNRVTGGYGGFPYNRPNNTMANLYYLSTTGYSNYNGASVQLKKRFSHGYLLQGSYTFGKVLNIQDDANAGDFSGAGTGYNGTQDASNVHLDYGRSSFDVRHRITVNGVWEIGPLSKYGSVVHTILGDWQLNAIASYESGRPFTVSSSVVDYNTDGGGAAQAPPQGSAYDRPDTPAFGNSVGCRSPHDYVNGLFTPADFPTPPVSINGNGSNGTLGRNTFCGPNFKSLDLSLVRNFNVPFMGERGKIQFKAEAFNAFNRVNLFLPDADLGVALLQATQTTFGKSTQAYTPRELQFGLKLTW